MTNSGKDECNTYVIDMDLVEDIEKSIIKHLGIKKTMLEQALFGNAGVGRRKEFDFALNRLIENKIVLKTELDPSNKMVGHEYTLNDKLI